MGEGNVGPEGPTGSCSVHDYDSGFLASLPQLHAPLLPLGTVCSCLLPSHLRHSHFKFSCLSTIRMM